MIRGAPASDRPLWVLLLALAMTVGAARPTLAADWSTWQRQMEAAESAWEQGRWVGAEQWLQDAAREAERQDPRSPQLVRTLKVLAELYRKQGRPRDADAVTARLKALVPATGAAAGGANLETALEAYGTWLKELGRERDATMVAIRLHRLREVQSGTGRGEFLFFNPVAELRDYAWLLRQRNRESDARAIDALASAEAAKLIDRYDNLRKGFTASGGLPSLTWMQQMTGGAEAMDGRLYPEAAALFGDAVRTAERFPANDVRLAFSLSLLATALRAQGKTEDFATATRRAMTILDRAAGQGHNLLPDSLSVLALAVLRYSFDPATALPHLERSLKILERDVRSDHPAVGLHLAGLAATHLALGHAEQGKPLVERALTIAGQQYLPEHASLATAMLTVVEVYAGQGDFAQADRVAQRVQAILRRLRDPDHADVLLVAELRKTLAARMAQPTPAVALARATSVPLQLAGDAMLVHVTINGSQRALLLVDTGASTTAIRPLVLRRLGVTLAPDGPRRRVTVVSGQSLEVPIAVLDLQLADASVRNVSVSIVDAFPSEPDIDGLLGADFLQRFRVAFDRTSRRMTLEPLSR